MDNNTNNDNDKSQERSYDGDNECMVSSRCVSRSRNNDEEWSTRVIAGFSGGDSSSSSRHRVAAEEASAPDPYRRNRTNKILLVHGLECVPINCDRVFNLFCLYGNVVTVKVLKDNKVLVELEDVESAKRCVSNLHLLPLDDVNKMKVKYSKHSFIYDQVMLNKLPDGTPSQKVYTVSKLNRFPGNGINPDRRRIAAPSKILHFFNAPTDVCGLTIHKAVSEALGRTDAIVSITILPKRPRAKCSTGLIELKNIALAAKTILLSNHMTFESSKSKFPFLTKLCFSKWSEIQQTSADSATLRFCTAPRVPWMLHNSEHAVPATELPILRTSVVVTDGGGGDDGRWTLWTVRDDAPAEPMAERRADGASAKPPVDTMFENIETVLLDMLRNCLCGNKDDQGDVLSGPARANEDEMSSGPAVNVGPLGDA